MAISGIGVDIESIDSFKKLSFNKSKNFYNKIFTKKEIEYCLKRANPYQHFAVRFCAKEAFIKATHKKFNYKDIEVTFNKKKPTIKFPGLKIFLSMSHEKDKAIAFVVTEKKRL
ncbi:holo-ACP synthase [Candidatus Woesearchaeota archaeon]|nr:holo-ACP synthase [Candidatus Woesearchaeota archaeon]